MTAVGTPAGPGAALFDPFDPSFRRDPYPAYHRLRAADPVHWGPPTTPLQPGCWYVTRYADTVALATDPRAGRQRPPQARVAPRSPAQDAYRPFQEMAGRWMLFRDPPDHTRLRALVNRAFTPRTVDRLRPRIESIADGLLDAVAPRGEMDVIADLAFPLPVTVIAELLGVPAADHGRFRAWSQTLASAIDMMQSTDVLARASDATAGLSEYFGALVAERRRAPRDDLLSELVAAEEAGDRLSGAELVAMCVLLLVAGHETTVNLIGNGVLALLRHPDQWARLRADPSLVPAAVEELLRHDSPVQLFGRWAQADIELGGKRIRAGDPISLLLGAANRDAAQFPDPDALDVARAPNRHVAFGAGIHYCVGAPLARAEGQVALAALLRRAPGLRPTADALHEPAWRAMIAFRGLERLPVTF